MLTSSLVFGCSATPRTLATLLMLALACVIGSSAMAESKMHALVLGNANYTVGKLRNPTNDARLMQQTLADLGFKVTLELDLNHEAMEEVIDRFCDSVPRDGLAFVYYAGHGVQVDGHNYLIPLDARIEKKEKVRHRTVSEDYVLDLLNARGCPLKVLVLDCCRDNPFERSWNRGFRSQGLAPTALIPQGTLIAYSTSAGATAADGDGDNSPFTTALAASLSQKPVAGLRLVDAFRSASQVVMQQIGQEPWMSFSASMPPFYLRQPANGVAAEDLTSAIAAHQSVMSSALKQANLPQPMAPQSGLSAAASSSDGVLGESLFDQARSYYNDARYDLAIEAYSAILKNSSTDEASRKLAYKGRGLCLVGRGKLSDFRRALIDYKAAGDKGMPLIVRQDLVKLRVSTDTTGSLRRDQIATITLAKDDWFWVTSVNGDSSLRGWVDAEAFVKPVDSPPAAIVSTPPAESVRSVTRPQATQQVRSQTNSYSRNSMNQNWSSNNRQYSNSNRNSVPNSADSFTRKYMKKNGRPPSIWETPRWESPAEIRRLRQEGLLR